MKRNRDLEQLLQLAQIQQMLEGPQIQQEQADMDTLIKLLGMEQNQSNEAARLAWEQQSLGQTQDFQRELSNAEREQALQFDTNQAQRHQASLDNAIKLAQYADAGDERRAVNANKIAMEQLGIGREELAARKTMNDANAHSQLMSDLLRSINPATNQLSPFAEAVVQGDPRLSPIYQRAQEKAIESQVQQFLPQYERAAKAGPEQLNTLLPTIPPAVLERLTKLKPIESVQSKPLIPPDIMRAFTMNPQIGPLMQLIQR